MKIETKRTKKVRNNRTKVAAGKAGSKVAVARASKVKADKASRASKDSVETRASRISAAMTAAARTTKQLRRALVRLLGRSPLGGNSMTRSSTTATKSTRTNGHSGANGRGRSSAQRRAKAGDAIALLKADHRQVEGWFEEFEKARSDSKKQELAEKICAALKAHTTIEEEIFYPAFLEATEDEDIHHEAEVEHEGAKNLIAEIESGGSGDEYFDARVTVLSEMIKHHVKEEEKRDGMFAKAKASGMDLREIGEQMQSRKEEILGDDA